MWSTLQDEQFKIHKRQVVLSYQSKHELSRWFPIYVYPIVVLKTMQLISEGAFKDISRIYGIQGPIVKGIF